MKKIVISILVATSFLMTVQTPDKPLKFSVHKSKSSSFMQALKTLKKSSLGVTHAHAAARNTEKAMAQMLYQLVNGDGVSEEGLIGIIRDIIGPTALGGGIEAAGASSCADIPTSGSYALDDGGSIFNMYFGPGTLTVPARFSANGGGAMNKRIEVSNAGMGGNFFVAEFSCAANSTVISGYIRMNSNEDDIDQEVIGQVGGGPTTGVADTRQLETYFEFNTASDVIDMDFYMAYTTGMLAVEKFAVKASVISSSEFKFWGIRYFNPTAIAGSIDKGAFAFHADKDDDLMIMRNPAGGDADGVAMTAYTNHYCIKTVSTSPEDSLGGLGDCTGNTPALAVGAPGNLVDGSAMTVTGVQGMSLTALTHTLH